MGSHGSVRHDAAYRSNVNWRESSEETACLNLINEIRTVCILMVMDPFSNKMIPRNRRDHCVSYYDGTVVIFGILFLWISSLLLPGTVCATTIYSYIDDRGTPVLSDNFESIPERYRAKVQVTEQAPKGAPDRSVAGTLQHKIADLGHNTGGGLDTFVPNISGLTRYQSQVLSFGGIVAGICLLARLFLRDQVVRFLTLWCLIMLGLTVPALFFTSQDAPLDRLTGQTMKIQEKQQEHLQRAP